MAAYRLTGWGRGPELVEVPVPGPGPGQVRVRVAGCGLCHSDLSMAQVPRELGEGLGWQVPFTLGHETAGWVDAVGVGAVAPEPGTAVALASPQSCGRCRWCRAGRENRCREGRAGRGYGRDGGLAEYVIVDDPRALLPLEFVDPATAGVLTDAAATSHHAVRRVLDRLVADDPEGALDATVAVIGVGGLGAFAVQLLEVLSTVRVVAVDPDPVRRALALGHGAEEALPEVGEGGAALRAAAGPAGADGVIDLVGTDQTISAAVRALGPGGVLALVGAAGGTLRAPWYGSLPRDGEVLTFQGSDLADARAVIALAGGGRLRVDAVPFPLERADDAFAALEAGSLAGRVVVQPGPERASARS